MKEWVGKCKYCRFEITEVLDVEKIKKKVKMSRNTHIYTYKYIFIYTHTIVYWEIDNKSIKRIE